MTSFASDVSRLLTRRKGDLKEKYKLSGRGFLESTSPPRPGRYAARGWVKEGKFQERQQQVVNLKLNLLSIEKPGNLGYLPVKYVSLIRMFND